MPSKAVCLWAVDGWHLSYWFLVLFCLDTTPACSPLWPVRITSPCIIGKDWNAAPLMFIVIRPCGMWMLTQKCRQLVKSSAIWPSCENVSGMHPNYKLSFTFAVNRNILLFHLYSVFWPLSEHIHISTVKDDCLELCISISNRSYPFG